MHRYIRPFQPKGVTVNLAVTGSSQPIQITRSGVGTQSVRIHNIGNQTVFLNFGIDNTVTVTATNGFPILANTYETFTFEHDFNYIAAIAATTGSTIYITTGESA